MLADSCVPVATHRHGCCVLQRALDAATVDQSRMLVAQVCEHALQLMQVGLKSGANAGAVVDSRLSRTSVRVEKIVRNATAQQVSCLGDPTRRVDSRKLGRSPAYLQELTSLIF